MLADDDAGDCPELETGPLTERAARLDRLVAEQADELVTLHTALREIAALCDLAEWASSSAGDARPVVVRVEELRRVLAAHSHPAPAGR